MISVKHFISFLQKTPPDLYAAVNLIEKSQIPINTPEPITGNSLLMLAIQFGSKELVDKLLKLNASQEQENNKGHLPIDFCFLRKGHPIDFEILLLLLNPENINRFDKTHGSTAIMFASQFSSPKVVRQIISKGGKVDMQNFKGQQAMDFCLLPAVKAANVSVAITLIENGVDVNYVEKNEGLTALFYAVAQQDHEATRTLLSLGANPCHVTFTGVQPLDYALAPRDVSCFTDLELVLMLVEAGANANYEDTMHRSTPIMYACQLGSLRHVSILVEKGADVMKQKFNGSISIDYALSRSKPDFSIILYLIQHCGISVNHQSASTGNTALMLACEHRDFEVVCKIIKLGANVNLTNKSGLQALHFVMRASQVSISNLVFLIENGAPVNLLDTIAQKTPLICAVQANKLNAVKNLLKLGASVLLPSPGLVKLLPRDFSKDPRITELLVRQERVEQSTFKASSSSDLPPAYSPPLQGSDIRANCCVDTESRVRNECMEEMAMLQSENERLNAEIQELRARLS